MSDNCKLENQWGVVCYKCIRTALALHEGLEAATEVQYCKEMKYDLGSPVWVSIKFKSLSDLIEGAVFFQAVLMLVLLLNIY